ncbi:hypothetical protein DPMN_008868 [Dreissena polymorpha]|uniref:Uncharacterized protein n=1 Tax=Dreissena polymorpha TaxID=45954 RepID=A0A9D4S037_DREPO|nr:hypothetical protein DPMN_008868 [Dreissena polymorpha]
MVEHMFANINLWTMTLDLKADDCLLVSLDTTLNTDEIQKAYLNPTGSGHDLYWNALWRFNNDYGAIRERFNWKGISVREKREPFGGTAVALTVVTINEYSQRMRRILT